MGAPVERGRFRNQEPGADHGLADVARWLLTRRAAPWPRAVPNLGTPVLAETVAPGEVAVTFINHATFLLQTAALTWLTDPVFAERASPVSWAGPRRVRRPGLALEDLPSIDVVLLSHNHYDHMDLAALARLESRFHPLVLTGRGNRATLARAGLGRVVELDWDESVCVGDRATATFTPAQHFSARTPFDRNRSLWGGYYLRVDALRAYFAGDSGYAGHFRDIHARFGAPHLALLPIGAYEPRWFMKMAHMNPEEAVQAHQDLRAVRSLGMHFGTFPLTDEPIDAPLAALASAREAAGLAVDAFTTLEFGETRWFAAIPDAGAGSDSV